MAQAVGVGAHIHKLQRIGGSKVLIFHGEAVIFFAVIQQQRQTGARIDAEVALALGADVPVLVQVFLPDHLAAAVTLHPQTFGAYAFLARGFQLRVFAFKPGHS